MFQSEPSGASGCVRHCTHVCYCQSALRDVGSHSLFGLAPALFGATATGPDSVSVTAGRSYLGGHASIPRYGDRQYLHRPCTSQSTVGSTEGASRRCFTGQPSTGSGFVFAALFLHVLPAVPLFSLTLDDEHVEYHAKYPEQPTIDWLPRAADRRGPGHHLRVRL